ncbi:hypothetical protein ACQKGL_14365 [Ensifer adhaerens]
MKAYSSAAETPPTTRSIDGAPPVETAHDRAPHLRDDFRLAPALAD